MSDSLTCCTSSTPPGDHFAYRVARSYLADTQVFDRQKEFIVDLATFCKSNTQLWTLFEHIGRDTNRVYAKISVSPAIYKRFLKNPILQLENFAESLMACSTLFPFANVIKLLLTRLSP